MGRPNVGKSALFNRMAGASLAVVFDEPGVTRDRLYTRAHWGDTEFVVIDTGAWVWWLWVGQGAAGGLGGRACAVFSHGLGATGVLRGRACHRWQD